MNTKPCRSCQSMIDANALKCPHCQAFQHWYRDPRFMPMLLTLPVFAFILWNSTTLLRRYQFADYQEKIQIELVREEEGRGPLRGLLITAKITNGTRIKWKSPTVEVLTLDEQGKPITAEHLTEYNCVLAPHGEALVSFQTRLTSPGESSKRVIRLTDLVANRN